MITDKKIKTYAHTHCSHYVLGECSRNHHNNCVGTVQCIKDLEQEYNSTLQENVVLLQQYNEKEQECEELKKDRKYLYNFLTNKYNYGSFRPMWGAYLLKHFFNENLGDFFDTKAYEMADTIAEKDKELDRYKQALEKIEGIVSEPCLKEEVEDCMHCGSDCEHKDILKILNEVKES